MARKTATRPKKKKPGRLHQFESAQIVWDELKAAGPDGLTFREILSRTNLSRGQVLYGFRLIKDVLMEANKQPLSYNHTTYRYSLPPEWHEVGEYVNFRVAGILTMIRRVESVANASALKWQDETLIQDVVTRVRLLRRDLETLANLRTGQLTIPVD
jgi:hypothetical protein